MQQQQVVQVDLGFNLTLEIPREAWVVIPDETANMAVYSLSSKHLLLWLLRAKEYAVILSNPLNMVAPRYSTVVWHNLQANYSENVPNTCC